MKKTPKQRQRIFDLYWRFAAERQAMFERRFEGRPPPWTEDPIFLKYKFCNVFRATDRVSQFMIKEVACNPNFENSEDQLFQIVSFRIFSRIETWELIRNELGHYPIIANLKDGSFLRALEHAKEKNKVIYTSAFILCANRAFGFPEKHLNHVALLKKMFVKDELGKRIRDAKSLSRIYELLHSYPLMGDFMSYQTAIDLNYSSQVNFSENDFCQVGPGAVRGIKKAFEDIGDFEPNDLVRLMVENQTKEFERLGLTFNGLWGRPLHAIDCQSLFCELDKYCRIAAPELKSGRQRIKTRFTARKEPIEWCFPPKWKLKVKPTVLCSVQRGQLELITNPPLKRLQA